jgi:membrane associated rhomboid family serine protease
LLIRYYWKFGWLRVPAWVLFIFWLVFQYFGVKQQLAGVSNVSALAHLGGVLAGLAFWVITRQTGNFSLFSGPVDYTRDQGVYNTNENG